MELVYGAKGCKGSGDQRCHRCNRLSCCDNLIRVGMTEEQIKKATIGLGLVLRAYLDIDEWNLSSHEPGESDEMVHESLPWPSDWPERVTVAQMEEFGFIVV